MPIKTEFPFSGTTSATTTPDARSNRSERSDSTVNPGRNSEVINNKDVHLIWSDGRLCGLEFIHPLEVSESDLHSLVTKSTNIIH